MQYLSIFVNISSILVTPTHVCYADQSRRRFLFLFDMPFWKKTCFCHCLCFGSILVNIRTYLPTIRYCVLYGTCAIPFVLARVPLARVPPHWPGSRAQVPGPGRGPSIYIYMPIYLICIYNCWHTYIYIYICVFVLAFCLLLSHFRRLGTKRRLP